MSRQIEIIVKTTDACNAFCVYCSAGSEPSPARRLDLPCITCEAFKFCRGLWLDLTARPDHCRAWGDIVEAMIRSSPSR